MPTVLGKLLQDKDPERSNRVMPAMLQMDKLDIKALQQAYKQKMTLHQGSHVSQFRKSGNLPEAATLPVCSIARLARRQLTRRFERAGQSALLCLTR